MRAECDVWSKSIISIDEGVASVGRCNAGGEQFRAAFVCLVHNLAIVAALCRAHTLGCHWGGSFRC